MHKLRDALRELRQEIEAGLTSEKPLPEIAHIEAEAVTLTLGLILDPDAGPSASSVSGWRPQTGSPTSPSPHSITITFRLNKAGVSGETTGSNGAPKSAGLSLEARRGAIVERCLPVFGEPGFDNSARAEVFCELAAAHTEAEMRAALGEIAGEHKAGAPAAPERLVLRLRQVLGFAPVGREAAANTLWRMFEEFSQKSVVEVVAERWRFGTHWGNPAESA